MYGENFPEYMKEEIAKCRAPQKHKQRYVGVAKCPECEDRDRTGHIHFTPNYDFWGREQGLRSA